jgi:hypothetical protein
MKLPSDDNHQSPRRSAPREDPETVARCQTESLAALALTLGLIVMGLFLVNSLREPAAQDDHTLVAAMKPEQ